VWFAVISLCLFDEIIVVCFRKRFFFNERGAALPNTNNASGSALQHRNMSLKWFMQQFRFNQAFD